MPDRDDGTTTKSSWTRHEGPNGEIHFKDKTPFVLSETPYRPPTKQSRDVIEVTLDEAWSQMRSEALGGRRAFWYVAWNATKGHEYHCEFFEGVFGEPCGVCDCPSAVPCKHLMTALADLFERVPDFGQHHGLSEPIRQAVISKKLR